MASELMLMSEEQILELANLHKGGDVWIGGGTFSGNPVSMVAGKATLDILQRYGSEGYNKLNTFGETIQKEIAAILERYNTSAIVTGVGSIICIHWFKEKLSELRNSSQVKLNIDSDTRNNFQLMMFNRNQIIRTGFGYLSFVHTKEDVENTIKSMDEVIKIITQNS